MEQVEDKEDSKPTCQTHEAAKPGNPRQTLVVDFNYPHTHLSFFPTSDTMATTFAGADAAVASYPTQSRRNDMAVAKINTKLSAIDLNLDSLVLPLRVIDVTEEDWEFFVDQENKVLRSKYMAWIEGAIFIVELPWREHDDFSQEFNCELMFQPAVRACLAAHGSGYMMARPRLPKLEPDQSYGPNQATVLPREVRCVADWITLVLEVGKSQK